MFDSSFYENTTKCSLSDSRLTCTFKVLDPMIPRCFCSKSVHRVNLKSKYIEKNDLHIKEPNNVQKVKPICSIVPKMGENQDFVQI